MRPGIANLRRLTMTASACVAAIDRSSPRSRRHRPDDGSGIRNRTSVQDVPSDGAAARPRRVTQAAQRSIAPWRSRSGTVSRLRCHGARRADPACVIPAGLYVRAEMLGLVLMQITRREAAQVDVRAASGGSGRSRHARIAARRGRRGRLVAGVDAHATPRRRQRYRSAEPRPTPRQAADRRGPARSRARDADEPEGRAREPRDRSRSGRQSGARSRISATTAEASIDARPVGTDTAPAVRIEPAQA